MDLPTYNNEKIHDIIIMNKPESGFAYSQNLGGTRAVVGSKEHISAFLDIR